MAEERNEGKPVKGPMGKTPRGVRGPRIENPGKVFMRLLKQLLCVGLH